LEHKDQLLQIEHQEKESLEAMIKQMEQKMVQGGEALDQKEKEQSKNYREYQIKMKKQRKREKKLLEEKRQREEEVINVEHKYKSLQEEVEANREIIDTLKLKYQQTQNELRDIEQEQQGDREELLDTIRQQSLDVKFFRKLCKMLMKDEEIARLRMKSSYDDDLNDWLVPPFILKGKEVTLPAMKKNAQMVMEQEKENRDLAIEGESEEEDQETKTSGLFSQQSRQKHSSDQKSQQAQ
jgi:hypothetical protein